MELIRPGRQSRRLSGQSGPLDAKIAAGAPHDDIAAGPTKSQGGAAETIRALRTADRSAMGARTQAANTAT